MGAAASAVTNALDNSQQKEVQGKERLEPKTKLAGARPHTSEAKLKTMFLAKESAQKAISGKGALRGVENAINAFFGVSDTSTKGVHEGFKSVVKTGLSAILRNSSAGESYDEKFFVSTKEQAPPDERQKIRIS
ncbi:hypothetical protein DL769_003428 [Monosporascus sp. CRB-8-3]|nr:hypothetical protein DL769_003428 [Monosporascus sp. CRB-8-3]